MSTEKNTLVESKYSKIDYRTEMQKNFTKELPNENDIIFTTTYKHYLKIAKDETSFKKACENASIALKAVIIKTGDSANNLYLESLMNILDAGKKDLKDQIMQESAKYDLLYQ